MANFETSRLVIDSNITANGNQEISGKVMNNVLNHMVDDTEAKITELEERIENLPSGGGGGEGGGGADLTEVNKKIADLTEETERLDSDKQDTLVSGSNIKTINNQSILGMGNITIEGGGGGITLDSEMSDTSTNAVSNKVIKEYVDNAVAQGGGGAMSNYPLVYVEDSVAELEMQPNTMYFIMTPRTLKLTLGEPVPNIVNEYCLLMVGGGANAPVTLPDSYIIWAGGNAPAFAEYALYEISMVYVQGILFGVSAEFSLM